MKELGNIDPDVKIPAAVAAAAARAEEMFHKYRDGGDGTYEAPAAEAAQEVTPEGNPELEASSLLQSAEPVVLKEPVEAPSVTTTEPADETESTWEHKYKSVHGRYVAQQKHLNDMAAQITGLQNVIATLNAPSAPLPEFKLDSTITPEEVADYGEDFLRVVEKKAKMTMAPVMQGYEAKISELEARLKGVDGAVQQSSHEKFLKNLDATVPQWREINTDSGFLDWLGLPDPYSGAIRHDMLKAAYTQGNTHRVAAFFNGFLAEEAAVAPANTVPDPAVTKVQKVPLQNLAAPGRAKTAASANAPAEKPTFTRAQISGFYADVAMNKYVGRDAAKNQLEAQIFDAQREGRIR